MGNVNLQLEFSSHTVRTLTGYLDKRTGRQMQLQCKVMKYTGLGGGPYIFLPDGPAIEIPIDTSQMRSVAFLGTLITELHVTYSKNVTLSFQLSSVSSTFDVFLHSRLSFPNEEMILRFVTPEIKSNGEFYVDSNGWEMSKRKFTPVRFGDNTKSSEISGNYYPHTRQSLLKDSQYEFIVMSQYPMGVSSQITQASNSLEFMINRNTLQDDFRGVDEAVVSPLTPLKTTFRILLTKVDLSNILRSKIAQEFHQLPLSTFFIHGGVGMDINQYKENYHVVLKLLGSLPESIHLSLLRVLDNYDIQMRLHHMYTEYHQAKEQSVIGTAMLTENPFQQLVNISMIFPEHDLNTVVITSLTMLHMVSNVSSFVNGDSVWMNPGEIKVFQLNLSSKNVSFWNIYSFLLGIPVGVVGCAIVLLFLMVIFYLLCCRKGSAENKRKLEHLEHHHKNSDPSYVDEVPNYF